ncbi:MAG: response regulator [Ignavibacteria bacterium]
MKITEAEQIRINRTRILIVDDIPSNHIALGSILRKTGFQIAYATSGEQALSIASKSQPHLILLDISMPEMDGFTVCKKLKADPVTHTIPVIFVTAHTQMDSVKKAMDLGAIDYIIKPFNIYEVLGRILLHLGDVLSGDDNLSGSSTISHSDIIGLLQGEYMQKWNEIQNSMLIDDIINFAESIKKLGKEGGLKLLCDYSAELIRLSNSLEIKKMVMVLNQYPSALQKILLMSENL